MARTDAPPRNPPISFLDVRLWRGSSARLELSRHWSRSQGRQGVIRWQPPSRPESRELPPGPVPQPRLPALCRFGIAGLIELDCTLWVNARQRIDGLIADGAAFPLRIKDGGVAISGKHQSLLVRG